MAEKKIRVGVLFGGQSPEHEISLLSAKNVLAALDRQKYSVFPIAIDRDGKWYLQEDAHEENLKIIPLQENWVFLASNQHLDFINTNKAPQKLDVIFPVLHGPNGEDGSMQGLLQLANIPFVGAGVIGSCIAMDKDISKRLLYQAHIPTAKSICLRRDSMNHEFIQDIIFKLGLPCFVKPANMGSSVGVTKVRTENQLLPAIEEAMQYDDKVLIEEYIKGREIECSVLGNEHPIASLPGEIIPSDFYSYNAKYLDPNDTKLVCPADLPEDVIAKVQSTAIKAYKALNCEGMARADFFLTPENEVYVNELNTIPGFTNISMYPRMWASSGLSYNTLLDELIKLALERFDRRATLKTTYN